MAHTPLTKVRMPNLKQRTPRFKQSMLHPRQRMPHSKQCKPSSRWCTPPCPDRDSDRFFTIFLTKSQVLQHLAYWVLFLHYHDTLYEVSKPKNTILISKSKEIQKMRKWKNTSNLFMFVFKSMFVLFFNEYCYLLSKACLFTI